MVQYRHGPAPSGLPGDQPQEQPESVLRDELCSAGATEEVEVAAAGTRLACSACDGERALRSE